MLHAGVSNREESPVGAAASARLVSLVAAGWSRALLLLLRRSAGGLPHFAALEKGEEKSSRSCCLFRLAVVLVAAMAAKREEGRGSGGTRGRVERQLRAISSLRCPKRKTERGAALLERRKK
ncbi:hypothetical protein KY289_013981 [Solanum tuberosum]|nr:hypothetical protein KY289_013981 [Solanum tuberosum]